MNTVALQVSLNQSTSYIIRGRKPIFRVYRHGALKIVGTAEQLQAFFGIRHRELKVKLLRQADEPEDIQSQLPYQVELEADYLIAVEAERKFAKELADVIHSEEKARKRNLSLTLEEQIAMAQPNKDELLEELRKRNCRYRRYRNRRRLSERLADGMDSPETDTVLMPNGDKLVVVYGEEVDVEEWLKREQHIPPLAGRKVGGGMDTSTRKTKEELAFLNQRKEKLKARSSSIYY